MSAPLIQCPKCQAWLLEGVFNQPKLTPCPGCGAALRIDVFPSLFRPFTPGQSGEIILVEGESGCFYHPQKKAVRPCEACGRFVCALCDCEIKGRHLCPSCLQSGQKKQSIRGMEESRMLYPRLALVLAFIPLFVTGMAAVFIALRFRKVPGSLVAPMRWAMPVALIVGSLQTLLFAGLILWSIFA